MVIIWQNDPLDIMNKMINSFCWLASQTIRTAEMCSKLETFFLPFDEIVNIILHEMDIREVEKINL